MMRIMFPDQERYHLMLTGISSNNFTLYPEKKDVSFNSRINQFSGNEKLVKYQPTVREIEGLMEYRQSPLKDAGIKEVKNLETLIQMTRINKRQYTNKYNIGVWVAASSIILIVVLTAIIRHVKTVEIEKVYDSFFTIPSTSLIKNQTLLPFYADWNDAITAYETGNFAVAIDNFNLIPSGSVYSDYSIFYKGICFMAINQYGHAIDTFESISPSSSIYGQVKYYAGLCNMKLNRTNAAYIIFSDLTKSEELAKNAKEILLKLESID